MVNNPFYLAIASGKGGVGKSTLTLNIANILSEKDAVLAIDCDLGLANLDILLGKSAKYTLQDILCSTITPVEACLNVSPSFDIIPGSSGTIESISMDIVGVELFFKKLMPLSSKYKYIFLDIGAGITPITLAFIQQAGRCVLVVTPEPSSLLDAYALIKILITRNIVEDIYIIATMIKTKEDGEMLYKHISSIVENNMASSFPLKYFGGIVYSEDIISAIYKQKLFTSEFPNNTETEAVKEIAENISTISKGI